MGVEEEEGNGAVSVVVTVGERGPRTDRRLAGMHDEGVSVSIEGDDIMLIFYFQQANRAVKLRNLGQRLQNMLAKAGQVSGQRWCAVQC